MHRGLFRVNIIVGVYACLCVLEIGRIKQYTVEQRIKSYFDPIL
jgi:hypothetical protein